ncbi:zinc-finger domain-containing protein [Actimicrobium antarcticum]|uniref:Zinc-finger domain-containing protein n=1 Tax=Actimicrobium antarcticum TaxID=1051899 RepID=A0ABP7TCF7_9BURK
MSNLKSPSAPVELGAMDLPAHCPNDAMPVWSSHPRVFLDMGTNGHAKCPYCGTEYQMRPGEAVHAH